MSIEFRTLGVQGPRVSTIGLGCNNFGREGTRTQTQEGTTAVIDAALELGVTLLDTADMYGRTKSEEYMGVALRGRRDRVLIATKFGHSDVDLGIAPGAAKGSREYIREAVEGSLRRLQTDRIDLYQQHTPDPSTPIEETIAALEELVQEGRIRYYGHSNFTAEQITDAAATAARMGVTGFVSAQNHYSLVAREVELDVLPAVVDHGLGFLPYFPLANGLFTGKFSRTERPADTRIARQRPEVAENAPWDAIEAFERFCADRGVTILEGTFGWLLAQPALSSVIAGASRPEQLVQNAAAATAWTPTAEEVAEIGRIFA
ncbi:MAG TPA: aldo/keto reductase [Rhodoglobus sp.]|nr:aldo/keto reductase [Rhodoglobus sp.]